MTRSMRLAAALAVVVLAHTMVASSGPVSSRMEDVEATSIEGSFLVGETSAGPIIIRYEIAVTRATGRYLAATDQSPGTEYRRLRACISFSADFFSDSGCSKKVTFVMTSDLSKGTGSFRARMRQNHVWVKVSFSVKATSQAADEPRTAYGISPATSPDASAGRWSERKGAAAGWLEWPGYPRQKIRTSGTVARGTFVSAAAGL